jgi:hypothetical protein
MEEQQTNAVPVDSHHYRYIAWKLRKLARDFRFLGRRQDLLDLASRYERTADGLDAPAAVSSHPNR